MMPQMPWHGRPESQTFFACQSDSNPTCEFGCQNCDTTKCKAMPEVSTETMEGLIDFGSSISRYLTGSALSHGNLLVKVV